MGPFARTHGGDWLDRPELATDGAAGSHHDNPRVGSNSLSTCARAGDTAKVRAPELGR